MQTETPTLTVTRAGQRKGVGQPDARQQIHFKLYVSRCRAFSLLPSIVLVSLLPFLLLYKKKKKKKMHGEKTTNKHYASLKISSS